MIKRIVFAVLLLMPQLLAAQTAPDTTKPNPNRTRLFFAPTGRTLPRGSLYIADYYLFFPMAAYGVTDRLTVAGGFSIIPAIGFDEQVLYFAPKVGVVRSNKWNAAVGALLVHPPKFDTECSFDPNAGTSDCKKTIDAVGVLYGVGTVGGVNGSVTFAAGYGFQGGDLADSPLLVLGGEKRISRRVALVTENWLYPGEAEHPVLGNGVRLIGDFLTVDFAIVSAINTDAPLIPYIDFLIHLK